MEARCPHRAGLGLRSHIARAVRTPRLRYSIIIPLGLVALGVSSLIAAEPSSPAPTTVRADAGAHYAHLFGQTYRTNVDLYLFALYDDPDAVYLGRNDGSGGRIAKLPPVVASTHVGLKFGVATILDVVPAGAEFVLASETHDVTAESGIRDQGGYPMGFICTLSYKGRQMPGVLCEFIQAAQKAPPRTPNQAIDRAIALRFDRPQPQTSAASARVAQP